MIIRKLTSKDESRWDDFIKISWNGTFLHSRNFLSYHGERFKDVSLIIENDNGNVIGVFPAGQDPNDVKRVISHPGSSFGGIVHKGDLQGEELLNVCNGIIDIYRKDGYDRLRYKAVPYIYHSVPASDDLYAMFRLHAIRYRCDISAAIDLTNRPLPSERRIRSLKKVQKKGVKIYHGVESFDSFWPILEDNLRRRHSARPVHSLDEIKLLYNKFPEQIQCVIAIHDDQVVAGVVLFKLSRVVRAQYIGSSEIGNKISALDAIFDYSIRTSFDQGYRYFDFGISNESEGKILNNGLYQFKTSFGAGGVTHDFFEIGL